MHRLVRRGRAKSRGSAVERAAPAVSFNLPSLTSPPLYLPSLVRRPRFVSDTSLCIPPKVQKPRCPDRPRYVGNDAHASPRPFFPVCFPISFEADSRLFFPNHHDYQPLLQMAWKSSPFPLHSRSLSSPLSPSTSSFSSPRSPRSHLPRAMRRAPRGWILLFVASIALTALWVRFGDVRQAGTEVWGWKMQLSGRTTGRASEGFIKEGAEPVGEDGSYTGEHRSHLSGSVTR